MCHRSLGGLTEILPVRCLELNAQKLSVMLMNGGRIILALLQLVTTVLGQNYPVEHSVMRDMFNYASSSVEVANYGQLLSP